MDIKFKNHFWPKPNLTKKIEFVSKDVQIVEPETFGLLMFRSRWNFGSRLFEDQTTDGNWVWSPVMCRWSLPTGSNWTVQWISNFGNHTMETKLLYIYIYMLYISRVICYDVIYPEYLINWTAQFEPVGRYHLYITGDQTQCPPAVWSSNNLLPKFHLLLNIKSPKVSGSTIWTSLDKN